MSRALSLAGFQVILIGRFWVTTEGQITHDFPGMCKATGSKTLADPYVVALAQMQNYTVVANENMRRKNRKIPGVCLRLKVRCMTLARFVAAEVSK
jgi:hypothetical protein